MSSLYGFYDSWGFFTVKMEDVVAVVVVVVVIEVDRLPMVDVFVGVS